MATQVTVSGTITDAAGRGFAGTVTFTPTVPLYDTSGNLVVGTAPVEATVTSGALSVVIYATDDASTTPSGATYTISEALTGTDGNPRKRSYKAEIPSASATLRYEDIAEAVPSTQTMATYATQTYVQDQSDTLLVGAGAFVPSTGTLAFSGGGLPFDGTTQEVAVAVVVLPEHWTTYDASVIWYHVGGSAGEAVRWQLAAYTPVDGVTVLNDGYNGEATDTAYAALVTHEAAVASGFTAPSTRVVSLNMYRMAADAADTMSADAVFLAVKLTKAT